MQIRCTINLAERRIAPREHGFSFFQVKMFTGSVSVLLTSIALEIKKKILFFAVTLSVCREMLNAI